MLKGYVTYLAAAGMFLVGLYQYFTGDGEAAMKSFVEALGFAGLRRALGSGT